jgi:hypothetical protein
VREQLSLPGFPDEPELFDSLETWQQFLAEVEAMAYGRISALADGASIKRRSNDWAPRSIRRWRP